MFKAMWSISKWIFMWCILTTLSQSTAATDADSKLISFKSDGLSYSYETDNGIKRTESIQLKNLESPVVVLSGSYAYTDPKGVKVSVDYAADEKGFVPRVKIGFPKELPSTPAPAYPKVGTYVIESLIHNG